MKKGHTSAGGTGKETREKTTTSAGLHGLVPVPTPERPLTSAQQSFRDLLLRVESLREEIDAEEERLDGILNFYVVEVVPRQERLSGTKKTFVRAIAPRLTKASLPRAPERIEMRELVQELLDEIAKSDKGLSDADLREIYADVHGVDYAEHERKTIASARAALAHAFAEAGLEADFSELDACTSEVDFMARAEELTARVRKMREAEKEDAHCRDFGNHSSDDDQLRAADEFRKRSVANIYKQLARMLHPDLERDRERQKQKVELMQELTVAFRQNDLHTLLRLEMEWIEKEGGDVARLTDEKLGVYNDVLSGQVDGLEKRLRDLSFHARYRPIVEFDCGRMVAIDGEAKARDLDERIAAMERALVMIAAAQSSEGILAAVAVFRPGVLHPHLSVRH